MGFHDRYRTKDDEECEEESSEDETSERQKKGAIGDEEEKMEENVNFGGLLSRGEPLVLEEEHLEENVNLSCVVRRIMGALSKEELDQRENLFHTRCRIMDKVCSLIIDSGVAQML